MLIIPSMPATGERPIFYKLGETSAEINIDSVEENRNAAFSLAKQARRRINIFTQDMDAPLYDNEEFEHHLFKLALRHPSSEIRILVQDSTRAVQRSHRIIRLAHKLTSSIFIRKPVEKYRDVKSAFITVDGVGMIYRIQATQHDYNAAVNFMSPMRTGKLDDFFDEVWDNSEQDPQARRIFM